MKPMVRYIFMSHNSKKSVNLAACAAKFSLYKIHRDLKNEYFWENLQIPSVYFKEQLQKIDSLMPHFFPFLSRASPS